MNLLCAQDLPGAEGLDCHECLATLDRWARRIESETDKHFYRYKSNPAEFDKSEAYFRMLMMSVVLYEDFGVRYNPERMSTPGTVDRNDHFFADSRDVFLHGMLQAGIQSPRSKVQSQGSPSSLTPRPLSLALGTCSSMPVLYVALGRRLGYPLKLAVTKSHLFLRWESPTERFDMEATGKGMNRYDDEHFKRWPFPVTDEEIKADGYLKSLTPVEELAVFLSLRGHCLKEAGRTQDAVSAYSAAARLVPSSRAYPFLVAETLGGAPASLPANASGHPPSFSPGLPPEALSPRAPSRPEADRNPQPKVR